MIRHIVMFKLQALNHEESLKEALKNGEPIYYD